VAIVITQPRHQET